MPSWEHGSEERLEKAAMALCDDHGFKKTSASEIARRAGVTTRTFFRYFPDKREVLFAGTDDRRARLVDNILKTPDMWSHFTSSPASSRRSTARARDRGTSCAYGRR